MVNELWQHSSVAQGLKEEGREEGRVQEARELAQFALENRFGTLSEDILVALKRADEATLKTIIILKRLEDVRAHLGLS